MSTKKPKMHFKKIHQFTFDQKEYKIKYSNKKWTDGSYGECEDRDWEGNREIRVNLPNIDGDEKKLLAVIIDESVHASFGPSLCNDKVGIFSDELSELLFQMGWRLPT